MTAVPSQLVCRAEYTRPGGRQPGDRIVRCDLPAGHRRWGSDHRETETSTTWPVAIAPAAAVPATTKPAPAAPVPDLLTPGEVAALFRVDPKTVTRWAAAGRLSSIRTPGGHRRFRRAEVETLLGIEADG